MFKDDPLDAGLLCSRCTIESQMERDWEWLKDWAYDECGDVGELDYETVMNLVVTMANPKELGMELADALYETDAWTQVMYIRDDVVCNYVKRSLREIIKKGE